ncbi:MAG: universal stress protein [Aquabacterium sp.]|nr:universal stress protein [Ferruginibacter sp.]
MELNIKKILVPVDFSPASVNALDSAIAMAKRLEAELLLVNVVEKIGLSGSAQSSGQELIMMHHAEQELQAMQHAIIEHSLVYCEAIVTTGIVSATITKLATIHNADLIIMGTHGSSGFKKSLIGLNAFNVVKNANCPVLTIPPQKKWDSFKKILFPVRPISAALEKYEFIRKLIGRYSSILKVLGLASNEGREVHLLKELSAKLNEKLRIDNVPSSTYFKVGEDMADEVLKIAQVMDTDLIVITASMDTLVKQNIVSPYTHHIINHASYPVLSIKPLLTDDTGYQPGHFTAGGVITPLSLYN